MALIPYVDPETLEPEFQKYLERPINLFRMLSNSTGVLAHFQPFGEWIRWDCEFDGRLRELLILTVGYLTRNEYEFTHHVEIGRKFGVSDEDIDAIMAFVDGDEGALQGDDLLLATVGRELTLQRELGESTAAALTARFSAREVVDIVAIAAFYNMVVRILGGLRIDNEPEFARNLERFPLPA